QQAMQVMDARMRVLDRDAAPAQATTARAPVPGAVQRPAIGIVTPWHPEPVDNGSKLRLKLIIDTLAPDYDITLISLLDEHFPSELTPAPVPGVACQRAFRIPTYQPRSVRAAVAGLHPLPRSFAATWDAAVARSVAHELRQ